MKNKRDTMNNSPFQSIPGMGEVWWKARKGAKYPLHKLGTTLYGRANSRQ